MNCKFGQEILRNINRYRPPPENIDDSDPSYESPQTNGEDPYAQDSGDSF